MAIAISIPSVFSETFKNAGQSIWRAVRGHGRLADKGNNIGTSYLGSGSERAFKGLGLGAIIESPRSSSMSIWRNITRSGGRWDKNRYVSRKGKWGGARRRVSANVGRHHRPTFKYDRAHDQLRIFYRRNIRARGERSRGGGERERTFSRSLQEFSWRGGIRVADPAMSAAWAFFFLIFRPSPCHTSSAALLRRARARARVPSGMEK